MDETDPDHAQLTKLLTDLANDPAAPPSTVDALSVIRAARAAADADGSPRLPAADGDDGAGRPSVSAPGPDDPAPGTVLQFRPSRRRRTLAAVVAAASVAAVAALVIPLSLSGGSPTSTSADAERAVAQSAAGDLAGGDLSGSELAGGDQAEAPVQPPAAAAAPAPGNGSATSAAAAGTAADAGSAPAENAPADGFAAGAACWPALSQPVTQALGAALPPGAFGAPQPLTGSCAGTPVGGALLPAATPTVIDTATVADAAALVVRISKADPGACVDTDPGTGVRCVRQPDGSYLASGGLGAPTVYAYGGGNEVAIGGSADTGAASGLSADQLAAAAQAVLGALG